MAKNKKTTGSNISEELDGYTKVVDTSHGVGRTAKIDKDGMLWHTWKVITGQKDTVDNGFSADTGETVTKDYGYNMKVFIKEELTASTEGVSKFKSIGVKQEESVDSPKSTASTGSSPMNTNAEDCSPMDKTDYLKNMQDEHQEENRVDKNNMFKYLLYLAIAVSVLGLLVGVILGIVF